MVDIPFLLDQIRAETDTSRKNLRVAALVSQLFREVGADPVIVGGSAVEFYTDGQYVSGDVDVCFTGARVPTPRQREDVMAQVGRSLSMRQWDVAGVMVDILSHVETTANTPFQQVGEIKLIQIEDLVAERILVATYPQYSAERAEVARLLLAMVLSGMVTADLDEMRRVAESSDYDVGEELSRLTAELEKVMKDVKPATD